MKSVKNGADLPGAWICNPRDKGRKSIKGGNIYLKNNEEFLIELFNPLNRPVLSDIRLNGDSIFETYCSTIYKLLPEEVKPIEIKNKTKNKESDVFELIKKLKDLFDSGIITSDEFDLKKSELLSRI